MPSRSIQPRRLRGAVLRRRNRRIDGTALAVIIRDRLPVCIRGEGVGVVEKEDRL